VLALSVMCSLQAGLELELELELALFSIDPLEIQFHVVVEIVMK
jgi:hypothetical protein